MLEYVARKHEVTISLRPIKNIIHEVTISLRPIKNIIHEVTISLRPIKNIMFEVTISLRPIKNIMFEVMRGAIMPFLNPRSDFMNTIEKTSIHSYFPVCRQPACPVGRAGLVSFFGEKKGR